MTTMIAEVYDALKDVGVSDDKAREAAKAMASHEDRLDRIEIAIEKIGGKLDRLTWMLGLVVVVVVLPYLKDLLPG